MQSPLESETAFNEYRVHRLSEQKEKLVQSEEFTVPVPLYRQVEEPKGSGNFVRRYLGFSEVKVTVTVDWCRLAYEVGRAAAKANKKRSVKLRGGVVAKVTG